MKNMMWWKVVTGALVFAMAGVGGAVAAEKKNMAPMPAGVAQARKGSTEALRLSIQLAQYADKNKDALAMIVAAQLRSQSLAQARTFDKKQEGKASGESKPVVDISVNGMLDRAKQYAGDRKDLLALADDVAKSGSRGRVKSANDPETFVGTTVVNPKTTDSFKFKFKAGEPGGVGIRGDGDTDLDLIVLDEHGNQICKSEKDGDDETCIWTPKWTGEFKIRVVNHGNLANRYVLVVY